MKFAVVGAGILGASTAYHLALDGHSVTIVDAVHQGKATLAGAGIVCPWATKVEDSDWYPMYAEGARYYDELVSGLASRGETELGYRKVGALVVADERSDFDAAGERLAKRTADAPESGGFEELPAEKARGYFPPLRQDLQAFYIPGAARVDARLLANAMVRAAVNLGADYRSDLAALSLDAGRIAVRDGNGRKIDADAVIVTAGAWAARILEPLGLLHPVFPQRGQIVHLGLPGVDTSRWSVLLPMASHYLLAFDDSRVVVGASRENGAGFDYRVTAAGQHEVLTAGLHYAPGLATASLIETRIGFRPAAPTIRPILGGVPGIEGLFVGNGLGASGITVGPYAGRQLAKLATGDRPEIDLESCAPTR